MSVLFESKRNLSFKDRIYENPQTLLLAHTMSYVIPKGEIVLSVACLQTEISFGSLEDWLWPSVPWPQNSGIQPANMCKRELSRGFFCLFWTGYCSRADLSPCKGKKETGSGAD